MRRRIGLPAMAVVPALVFAASVAATQPVGQSADPGHRRIEIDQATGVALGHAGVRVEYANGVRVYRVLAVPYPYDEPEPEPEPQPKPRATEPAPTRSADDGAGAPAVAEPRRRYRPRRAPAVVFFLRPRRHGPGAFKHARRHKRSVSKTTAHRRSMRRGRWNWRNYRRRR